MVESLVLMARVQRTLSPERTRLSRDLEEEQGEGRHEEVRTYMVHPQR